MYNAIKKILEKNGTCLLIENGEPIGVVLTINEYELLQSKSQTPNPKSQTNSETSSSLFPEITPPQTPPYQGGDKGEVIASNPIGEALAQEMDYPAASANLNEIEAVDDVTLEDLGIDEEFPS